MTSKIEQFEELVQQRRKLARKMKRIKRELEVEKEEELLANQKEMAAEAKRQAELHSVHCIQVRIGKYLAIFSGLPNERKSGIEDITTPNGWFILMNATHAEVWQELESLGVGEQFRQHVAHMLDMVNK